MTHIGLVGGIGPAATTMYYTRLIEAFKAANQPLSLTISHADIATLVTHAKSGDRQAQAQVFAKHLDSLKAAGCDIALVTALTGHFCIEETKALSTVALLDGVDVIDRFCEAQNIKVLGLLGSPPVLSTHLFGMLKRVKTVVPQKGLDELGQAYMTVANSGVCTDKHRGKFLDAASDMINKQNADAILLAGTDLGLAFDGQTLPYQVIDAVDVHVEAIVNEAGSSDK